MALAEYVFALQTAFPKGGEIQQPQAVIEDILGVDGVGLREVLFALHVAGYITVKPLFEGQTVTFSVSWSSA